MTEARHDQAVALLTAASPTIVLLVEREGAEPPSEGDAAGTPRARMHSPPPPGHGDSPPEETPSLQRNHLPKGLEDQYPIEVSLLGCGLVPAWAFFIWNVSGAVGGWAAVTEALRSNEEPPCPLSTCLVLTHPAPPASMFSSVCGPHIGPVLPLTLLLVPSRKFTLSKQVVPWDSAS